MQRKLVGIIVIMVILVVTWIYTSAKSEVNNTIVVISQKQFIGHGYGQYFIKDYILEPSHQTCKQSPFLVIIVTSYVGHVELRSAHRRAMPLEDLQNFNAVRIFLLAKIPEHEKFIAQEAIRDESSVFEDILQGSFTENYRNLTHKHMMGLHWASNICSKSSFILKVDDDTVFNLNKTYDLLKKLKKDDREDLLMGFMLNNTIPRRNKQNKWYVSTSEFPRSIYPPYLSGWYYITTPNTAGKIVNEGVNLPYFWIDDIFITGLVTEILGIKLRHLPSNYWLEYYELLECCLRDMIKRSIRCDSVVGPNGGRNNLIVEFNDALRHCDTWKNCTLRSDVESLNKMCVAFKDRDIFGDGQAVVQNIKL